MKAISIKKQISDSSDINCILEYQKLDIEQENTISIGERNNKQKQGLTL